MKKKFITIILPTLFILFFFTQPVKAAVPGFNGGVTNEYEYEEMFFLAGHPMKFKGTVKIAEKESKGKKTVTYTYKLEGSDPKDVISRKEVYEANVTEREDKGQTTEQMTIKSYSESIKLISGEQYKLDDYQFSNGIVRDNRPASEYNSGNFIGRKIYLDKDKNRITVNFTGKTVGYENFWGATETQIIENEIVKGNKTGYVTSKTSTTKSKTMEYEPHDPPLSSFEGGYAVLSSANMTSEYEINIPYFISNQKSSFHLYKEYVPTIERLIVPKFRDLSNHWAKDEIQKLYSLGVFDESTSFFSPNTPMTRYFFTVGVVKAVDARVFEDPKKKKTTTRSVFKDISSKDPNYSYITSGVDQGIIAGYAGGNFKPNGTLTRVQAAAILVRALGMENRAPSPGYQLKYSDSYAVPSWSKDSVYVATELGFFTGDTSGRFNPNKALSRAEAAAILSRFLDFLENDLKVNYRDDMLNF